MQISIRVKLEFIFKRRQRHKKGAKEIMKIIIINRGAYQREEGKGGDKCANMPALN